MGTNITLDQTTADYTLTWADPGAARALSIIDPGGNDSFTFNAAIQTLTNKTLTSPTINTATITGGTIDNAAIGGTTRNSGQFTTLDANGNVTLGDAAADTVTINGNATVPTGTTLTVTDNTALKVGAANPNIVLLGEGTVQKFIQAGVESTSLTVTFPIAFAAATTPVVVITPGVATGNTNNYISAISNTGFTVAGGLSATDTFYWIAIGEK